MLCYVTLRYVTLCHVMLRYVMLCYVMLCYVMLCCVSKAVGVKLKTCMVLGSLIPLSTDPNTYR